MIKYYEGDILTSGADVICHQVNCKGVMGAGLAKQIKEKYPEVFQEYKARCDKTINLLGTIQYVLIGKNKWIANLFCQDGYGREKRHTDYRALEKTLSLLKHKMGEFTIAIPYGIGCGLGGGDWDIVEQIIEDVFKYHDGELQIWKFTK